MTEQPEDVTIQVKDLDLIGAILTAQVKQSQWASNAVEENLQREIEEWKAAFVHLFEDVKEANSRIRNMDINDALSYNSHHMEFARKAGWWSPDFKKNF